MNLLEQIQADERKLYDQRVARKCAEGVLFHVGLLGSDVLQDLKEKIDAELTRRIMLTGPIVRSGVEL